MEKIPPYQELCEHLKKRKNPILMAGIALSIAGWNTKIPPYKRDFMNGGPPIANCLWQ